MAASLFTQPPAILPHDREEIERIGKVLGTLLFAEIPEALKIAEGLDGTQLYFHLRAALESAPDGTPQEARLAKAYYGHRVALLGTDEIAKTQLGVWTEELGRRSGDVESQKAAGDGAAAVSYRRQLLEFTERVKASRSSALKKEALASPR